MCDDSCLLNYADLYGSVSNSPASSLSLHREFRRVIKLAHQLMHTYNLFYIKTFKIAPNVLM